MKQVAKATRVRFLVALLTLNLAAPSVWAQDMVVSAESAGGVFTARMEVFVDAPPDKVFAVITNYERLHLLDKRIKESRVLDRPSPNVVVVYTRTRTCMLICRSLERVERVVERPHGSVEAVVDPDRSDVLEGRTHWQLISENGGTRLQFETSFRPSFWVPGMVGRSALRRTLKSTARAMVQEAATAPGDDSGS